MQDCFISHFRSMKSNKFSLPKFMVFNEAKHFNTGVQKEYKCLKKTFRKGSRGEK